jgi:hypothetical protein
MEKFLENTPIPWVKVTDPSSGKIYYSTATHEYPQRKEPDPTPIQNVIIEPQTTFGSGSVNTGSLLTDASFLSPDLTFTKGDSSTFDVDMSTLTVVSSSFATTSSYAVNHAVITSSYICDGILASNQTFTTGSDTIIAFIDYLDPNGWLTSNQFKPTIAGYYNISFGVWLQNPAISSNQVNTQMRKNGNSMILSQQPLNNGTGIGLGGSRIIQMNGTTDYIDWTIFQGSGDRSTGTLLQGTANGSGTWFSAFLLTQ